MITVKSLLSGHPLGDGNWTDRLIEVFKNLARNMPKFELETRWN